MQTNTNQSPVARMLADWQKQRDEMNAACPGMGTALLASYIQQAKDCLAAHHADPDDGYQTHLNGGEKPHDREHRQDNEAAEREEAGEEFDTANEI